MRSRWGCSLACALSIGLAGGAQAEEAGTWRGAVDQPASGSYDVIMVLDGQGGGQTDYPSLACGGALSGGPGTYAETITYNRAVPGGTEGCLDGSISVSVSGDTLSWQWSGTWEGQPMSASAVLTRSVEVQAVCTTCGRALASDVSFGLGSSAALRTYVQQSLGKYRNCIRAELGGCGGNCWKLNLSELLPNCESFDDAGHRACVDQTVQRASSTCQ